MTARACTRCGTRTTEWCPTCLEEWENRRDAKAMTKLERLTEFQSWCPILEIPFEKLHQRIEELVGRPVFTHELAHPTQLEVEIMTNDPRPVGLDDVLSKLPPDLPIAVVELP